MIISLSISNFRSFFGEQTFSLVASKRLGSAHKSHCLPIPGSEESVLRSGVIYGANGAGKSNLFKALEFLQRLAIQPGRKAGGTRRVPFRLADSKGMPTSFDLEFIASNKHYRFGCSIDDERIVEEWLVVIVDGREKIVYERTTNEEGQVQIEGDGLTASGEKLVALATVGGPKNQSFLATVRATLQPADFGTSFSEVIAWFAEALTLIGPESSPASLGEYLLSEDDFRAFASDFLKFSSTGVNELKVEKKEISEEEFKAVFPKGMLEAMPERQKDEASLTLRLPNGREFLIQRTESGDKYFRMRIQAAHKHKTKEKAQFELSAESDGTRRLLDLLPALYHLKASNAVYFVDEIDRSMHPMLVQKFLEYFLTVCTKSPCQIIVTTHESHLLNLDLLRRDEIWFAEKDQDGATSLYSLTDFKVRTDLQVRKGYFEGRFGAVPFLGDLDRLIENHSSEAECR